MQTVIRELINRGALQVSVHTSDKISANHPGPKLALQITRVRPACVPPYKWYCVFDNNFVIFLHNRTYYLCPGHKDDKKDGLAQEASA